MNNLKFELYDFHAEVYSIRFLLVYLFLENNENCSRLIRTNIIAFFLTEI